MKSYTFHTDPGHGWLEVDKAELVEFNIADKISQCSYQRGNKAFLEEDCDAMLFVEAFKAKYGASPLFLDNYRERTPITSYARYQA